MFFLVKRGSNNNMGLRKKLKQYGFSQTFKTYFRSGILFYAFLVFLIVKKDKKGLEQFRDILNNKLYSKLYKKNKKFILKTKKTEFDMHQGIPKIIWFCWFQGIDAAPALVKKCFNLLQKNLTDYKINIITSDNFTNFSNIPDYIIEKWEKGIISNTHFSDILRNNLLLKNGGYWIDSTVFVSNDIPTVIQNSSFFLFQTYKPGCDGKCITISSWFIGSVKDNPVLELTQELLFNYWKKTNYLLDYFLYHNYLQMSLNYYGDILNDIPKYTNETTHFLLFELQKCYREDVFKDVCGQTFAHKLTYKLPESFDKEAKESFYYYFVNEYKG